MASNSPSRVPAARSLARNSFSLRSREIRASAFRCIAAASSGATRTKNRCVGFWSTGVADDSEIYGSIISHVGWEGSDRGHGHSIYVQNANGTKRITDNILFESFSFGVHAYTSNGRIDNIAVSGNILFNHGILSASGPKANVLFAGDQVAQSPTVSGNYAYYALGSDGRDIDISACNNGRIQNNYLAGGTPLLNLTCSSTLVTGNTTFGPVSPSIVSAYPSNAYGTTPTGVTVGVRPSVYESGRANIVVYNWTLSPTVTVNLAGLGLAAGDAIEVRDAQNFFGPAVFAGTYTGSVVLPMTGLAAAPVIGNAPVQPGHTSAQFGAFVVMRAAGGTTPSRPTASLTASPSTIAPGASPTPPIGISPRRWPVWPMAGVSSPSPAPTSRPSFRPGEMPSCACRGAAESCSPPQSPARSMPGTARPSKRVSPSSTRRPPPIPPRSRHHRDSLPMSERS